LAVATVMGAAAAFASVATGQLTTVAAPDQVKPSSRAVLKNADGGAAPTTPPKTTTTTPPPPPPPPPPKPILPFNAKLSSQNIPALGGGVRRGGCSGSLVAPQWVVTAGHCFHDINDVRVSGVPPYTMTVTVGKLADSDTGGSTAQVVDVRQSPVNDLAVVKLSAPVAGVVPLELADQAPPIGQQLKFAGWGSLSATVIAQSDHLKRGVFTVSTIGPATLEALPVAERTVENTPCPEDSGAPFFTSADDRTGTLVAIVSTGPACPQPGAEIVARVDVQSDWIREQTGGAAR
jgi:secreted trypsin-like serine protease